MRAASPAVSLAGIVATGRILPCTDRVGTQISGLAVDANGEGGGGCCLWWWSGGGDGDAAAAGGGLEMVMRPSVLGWGRWSMAAVHGNEPMPPWCTGGVAVGLQVLVAAMAPCMCCLYGACVRLCGGCTTSHSSFTSAPSAPSPRIYGLQVLVAVIGHGTVHVLSVWCMCVAV